MNPAEVLRVELAAARRDRVSFEAAWEAACTSALNGVPFPAEWVVAFAATQRQWRLAYERRGPRKLVESVTALQLVELAGDVPAPAGGGRLVA